MAATYDLDRFVTAQEGVYDQALAELRRGRKTTHWMWFVFPQIAGLGRSSMAQRYAISGADEARAYLDHPVLGPRLIEGAQAIVDSDTGSAESLMGGIDAMKLRSSMTLFAQLSDNPVFTQVLEKYFKGHSDDQTLERLRGGGASSW